MAHLKDRYGTVVSVADERVDNLLRNGFTRMSERAKAPAKKAAKKATKARKKA